jgi:hypothetical protein
MTSTLEKAKSGTPMYGINTEPIADQKIDKPIKFENPGPPDGDTAAWLVLLGAWYCSFRSPGWINSTLRLLPQHIVANSDRRG